MVSLYLLDPPRSHLTVNRADVYFSIELIGAKCFPLKSKLKRSIQEYVIPKFRSKSFSKQVVKYQSVKDRMLSVLRSSVTYYFKCCSCNATYFSQTKTPTLHQDLGAQRSYFPNE